MRDENNSKRMLTVVEAAQFLRCSVSLLNQDRVKGVLQIPFVRLGRKVLYDPADLESYLEGCKTRWNGAA